MQTRSSQTPLGAVYLSDHTRRWSSGRGRKWDSARRRETAKDGLACGYRDCCGWSCVLGSPTGILDPSVPILSTLSPQQATPPPHNPANCSPVCCSVSRVKYLPTGPLNSVVVSERICRFRTRNFQETGDKSWSFQWSIINSYWKSMNQEFLFIPINLSKKLNVNSFAGVD